MLDRPPRGKEWHSWLYVVLLTLAIFLTVPFARLIADFVESAWGTKAFTYATGFVIAVAAVVALWVVVRRDNVKLINLLGLLGVAGLFLYLTILLGERQPVEAVHYLQYGLLSLLIYRAFTHRIKDYSIHVAAVLVGLIVSILDETIQWLTPHRYFGFDDIGLNVTALVLVQVALVIGVRPRLTAAWPDAASLRRLCSLGIPAIVLLALCGLNTPERMAWYAGKIPGLGFLGKGGSVMAEYGYLYDDPEVGLFRSRLELEQVLQSSEQRAVEGAQIVDRYWDREQYWEFLKLYSSWKDPFLHEVRVHLFRRDVHVERGDEAENESARREKYTVAYWENRILEKYYGPLLEASSYVWPAEVKAKIRASADREHRYESPVSRHLITNVNQRQFLWISIGAVLLLLALRQYFDKRAGV